MDPRHKEAVEMRARGMSLRAIAAVLGVDHKTVHIWVTPGAREVNRTRAAEWNRNNPGRERQRKRNRREAWLSKWARIASDVAAGREPTDWEAA